MEIHILLCYWSRVTLAVGSIQLSRPKSSPMTKLDEGWGSQSCAHCLRAWPQFKNHRWVIPITFSLCRDLSVQVGDKSEIRLSWEASIEVDLKEM